MAPRAGDLPSKISKAVILTGGWGGPIADSNTNESPASRKKQQVITDRAPMAVKSAESCCAPSSRSDNLDDEGRSESLDSLTGPSHPGLKKPYLLDKRLLMVAPISIHNATMVDVAPITRTTWRYSSQWVQSPVSNPSIWTSMSIQRASMSLRPFVHTASSFPPPATAISGSR